MVTQKLEICIATFDHNSDFSISPTKFRGYVAHLFSNISEFHHHTANSYHYPLIQYKKIDSKIGIIGIGKYADVLSRSVPNIEHITTEDQKIPISSIHVTNTFFVQQRGLHTYRFSSPWIALNEQNYEKFRTLTKHERKKFLEKILVGNILSMYKGVGIFIENKIEVNILKQFSRKITAHQNQFVGFRLDFACNTNLPEYIGLGKSVSKGYGVIQEVK